ncbi:hypothetical protein B0H63DRAFT_497828 [Podospora didyma]|uniref:Zn(2)-C6 fungal-type domain-containing protein n=1 Tax=Podospora didyma TaxID=330526 RepID=A0AAE0K3D4_9PEZI|nr:hypothetical protein B0H63DRAFT_497828 [Podospora didyma]
MSGKSPPPPLLPPLPPPRAPGPLQVIPLGPPPVPPSHRYSTRRLRPLLPSDVATPSSSTTRAPLPPPPRRRAVLAACIACRKRKSKCSGGRPKCVECTRRETDCAYDTGGDETPGRALKRRFADLENQASVFENIYRILRTRPQPEADAVLNRIRAGEDPETILRHVQHGDLLLQLSVIPESRYRYEFPFMITLPLRLQTPTNNYLSSLIYEWDRQSPPEDPQEDGLEPLNSMVSADQASNAGLHGPYLRPYHAAEVIDPLIDSAEPAEWTMVSSDNALMRTLLRAYFLHEHHWYTILHKDCFLADMSSGRSRFCSSLLVNALLAMACFCHRALPKRAEFWNPHTLGYQFHAEAKRLWESEQNRNRLTTVQAAILLNLVYSLNGADRLGQIYTSQAIAISKELGLFEKPADWESMSPKVRIVRTITAWGLYGYECEYVYHFLREPLLEMPPDLELPDVDNHPEWYSEVWLKYPLQQTLYPMHFGHSFKALCEFRAIMKDVSVGYYFGRPAPRPMPSLEIIVKLYSRLGAWYNKLPEPLTARKIVFPGQMKLHMHYCHVVANMFQPLVEPPLGSRGANRTISSAQEVLLDAQIHYETVLRLYYLRHGFEGMDSFLLLLLSTIAFKSIQEIKLSKNGDDHQGSNDLSHLNTLRSTLILCAKGLYDQGRSWFLPQSIFRLVRDAMLDAEANLLQQFANIPDEVKENEDNRLRHIQSHWPVNIVDIRMSNPEEQQLTNLLRAYADLNLETASDYADD